MIYTFGDYELEPQRYELRCQKRVCHLEPQVFELLSYLMRHRDRVVTKQELFEHLWPTQFVSDATLHQRLTAARKAIGDSGRDQHTIQTIRGRGYRFIASVEVAASAVSKTATEAVPPRSPSGLPRFIVERETQLHMLCHRFALAQGGDRQVLLISGEAGIGKTALVEAFITGHDKASGPWIGHGQCMAQYGVGEAYRPLLEALGRLCRGPDGATLLSFLRQHAPSWVAQMPSLLPVAERARLDPSTHRVIQKVSKKGGVGGPVALASGYENTYPLPNRPE